MRRTSRPDDWPASTSTSPRVTDPSPYSAQTDACSHADRPDAAAAAEQRAQPVDRIEEIAAVALHHRQQQVAAGVAAEPRVLERRQPRQQHAPRLARVARERQRALEDVAGRQHAELVAQLPGAAAAVEHRDDGVEVQPRIASSGRRAGSADRCRRRSSRRSARADASATFYTMSLMHIPDAVAALERDLRAIFGSRLQSLVVYGLRAQAAHGTRATDRTRGPWRRSRGPPRRTRWRSSTRCRPTTCARAPRACSAGRTADSPRRCSSPRTSSADRSTPSRSSSAPSSPTTCVVSGSDPFDGLERRSRRPAARLRSAGAQPSAAPARRLSRDTRARRRARRADRASRRPRSPRCVTSVAQLDAVAAATMRPPPARHVERRLELTSGAVSGDRRPRRRQRDLVGRGGAAVPAVPRRGRAARRRTSTLDARHERRSATSRAWTRSRVAGRSTLRVAAAASLCVLAVAGSSVVVSRRRPAAVAQTTPLPELTAAGQRFRARHRPGRTPPTIDRMIRALKAASGDVVVVATVPDIDGVRRHPRVRRSSCSRTTARGIGDKGKDNGLLILLALKERQVWIEVGYDLEQWITDGFAGETSRLVMAPDFRAGDYGDGLRAGTARIVARIAQGRNVTLQGVRGAARAAGVDRHADSVFGHDPGLLRDPDAQPDRARTAAGRPALGPRRLERMVERRRPVRRRLGWRIRRRWRRRRRLRRRLRRVRRRPQRRRRRRRELVDV